MDLVFICSPYAGDIERNTRRAQRYCHFAYTCNKVPIAPHLLYPQFLDEAISEEREAGISMGIEILKKSSELWCFGNVLSDGMRTELSFAIKNDIPIRYFTEYCEEVKNFE
ncbi:MAG: DUF4406 domain-containing protein [Sedimentibacter sp.]